MSENSYPGGKGGSGVYQTLINQIPPHDVYCSATAGHDAVLQKIMPANRRIVIDRDLSPLEWWSRYPGVERWNCCGLDFLEFQFQLHRLDPDASICDGRSTIRDRKSSSTPSLAAATTANGEEKSGLLSSSSDATRFEKWFVLLDPPYPGFTRSGGRIYKFDEQELPFHERLLRIANRLQCMTMICCYPNEYYDDRLRDWRSLTYLSMVRSGEQRTEKIWMNYPEPSQLHDYRYLGADKRARERIKRQHVTLRNKLKRLSPLEREAFLRVAAESQDS